MGAIDGLLMGLSGAITPENLLSVLIGVALGTLIGVLPGIGPVGGLTILLPFTFHMDLTQAIVMMAGIYYGTMYGGSTTSILAAIPGEVASAVTVLDGHQMAKQGRASAALAIAAIGSFVAGTVGVVGVTFLSPPLISVALAFSPAEYFSLAILGLTMAALLGTRSLINGLAMAAVGLMLSTVGMDVIFGEPRLTFGMLELTAGIELVPVLMGIFGIAEVLESLEETQTRAVLKTNLFDLRKLWPSREEMRASSGPIARGSVLGFFVGILPGAGAVVSSFLSYAVEKRISRTPERFGQGAIEGVAGPEAANNAAAAGAMIPLLTLGLPYSVVTAILLSAMYVKGVYPSPLLMERAPMFFWTVIASMYVGNVMLLVLNLPLVGLWASLLRTPFRLLFPLILLFCMTGVYSANSRLFDLWVMLAFGVIGYLMRKVDLPAAPLALGLVLGPLIEKNLSQAMIISGGSPLILVTRPVSAVVLGMAFIVILIPIIGEVMTRRREVAVLREEEA